MTALGLIYRGELRRRWRSWLALAVMVAVASGVVLAAIGAGNRTATAYPRFVAAHGFDGTVYNNTPVPQLAHLPEVASVVEAHIAFNGIPRCACTHPIDALDLSVFYIPPKALARTVNLVAGRLPDQSAPDEVLASFNLEEANGIHVGSVIRMPFYAASQAQAVYSAQGLGPEPTGPTVVFHVVGIEAAELEIPAGTTPSYGLYTTTAFARKVLSETTTGVNYFVTLHGGAAHGGTFKSDLNALGITQLQNMDTPAVLVAGAIHPQAEGWWFLALLAAVAAVAVVGQALSRQRAVEAEEYPTLRALGMGPRGLLRLGMVGSLTIGAVGALGAVVVAYALSPIAPVGEARYAEPTAGFSFDPAVLLLGALATVVVVGLLGVWPALRSARHAGEERPPRPSAVAGFLAGAGAPPAAVIGVRHAFERGRGSTGVPVATAFLGTILAVAALCGTAIFSTSLTTLTTTPRLYGDAYQAVVYAQSPGGQDGLIARLEHSPLMAAVTIGTGAAFTSGHVQFAAFATQAVRGPTLLSAVTGRLPSTRGEIALGATTMRVLGAHVGSVVHLVLHVNNQFPPRAVAFRVVGTVALPTGIAEDQAGMGTGGAITLPAFFAALCPSGPGKSACLGAIHQSVQPAALVRAVPGPRGAAAIHHLVTAFPSSVAVPVPPTGLVNFGEAVNFPLIFGLLLALFGIATMVHLLVVSVARRRHEMGLLKAVGFVSRQVGAAVFWQATTVGLVGIVVGVPLGIVVGRSAWRAFALNIGVVALPIVDVLMIVAIAAGVLVAGALLAVAPAVVAGRSKPGVLLHTQ